MKLLARRAAHYYPCSRSCIDCCRTAEADLEVQMFTGDLCILFPCSTFLCVCVDTPCLFVRHARFLKGRFPRACASLSHSDYGQDKMRRYVRLVYGSLELVNHSILPFFCPYTFPRLQSTLGRNGACTTFCSCFVFWMWDFFGFVVHGLMRACAHTCVDQL